MAEKQEGEGRSEGWGRSESYSTSKSVGRPDSASPRDEHTISTRSVGVGSSSSEKGVEVYVSGTDYRDVLRKLDRLREMALEGLRREEGGESGSSSDVK